MHAKKVLWLVLWLLSGALWATTATRTAEAQTPAVPVAAVHCTPAADALLCELVAYLPDGFTGDPAALAVYHLGREHAPEAVVAAQGAPHAVILVDVSGSMDGYSDSDPVRQRLQEALAALPAGTRVAVIPFRQGLGGGQAIAIGAASFSGDVAEWQAAAGALEAQPGDGTCLYDAAHQAVTFLQQAVGPGAGKALILISDGQDEPSRGEQGPRCSAHTLEDVIALAAGDANNRVAISAVGLGQEVQSDVLQTLAAATGGLAGGFGDMPALLAETVRRVSPGAWIVRVRLWPAQGENLATLVVSLPDGTAAGDFTFQSPTDYVFAAVAIRGVYYDPAQETLQLIPELINPHNVAGWQVQLFLGADGVQAVYPQPFEYAALENLRAIDLPTDALSAGATYHAQICALSREMIRLEQEDKPVCAAAAFVYQPAALAFEVVLRLEGTTLLADLDLTQAGDGPITYEAQLFGKDGLSKYGQAGPLTEPLLAIPMAELPDGDYSLLIALTPDGRTPAQKGVGFSYTAQGLDFEIGGWRVTAEGEMVLDLLWAAPAGPTGYTVWLKRENQEHVAGPITGTVQGDTITVPLGDVPTGDYVVEVALGNPLNVRKQEVHLQGPGRFSTLLAGVRQHPGVLIAVLVVAAAASLLLGGMHLLARLRTGAVGLEPIRGAPLPGHTSRPLRPALPRALGGALRARRRGRQPLGEIALTALPDAARSVVSRLPWSSTDNSRAVQPVAAYPRLRLTVRASPDDAAHATPRDVDHFPFSIGRRGCDLVIADDRVSRRHAVITAAGDHLLIADCGSRNGTRLNGRWLVKGVPARLPLGTARLALGKATELTLEIVPGEASPASPREQNASAPASR